MSIPIKQFITQISTKLENNHIENSRLDAEILVLYGLNKTRPWLYANFNYQISKSKTTKINKLVKKRLSGLPIAYILGEKEFYKLKFLVNKNTLIPRPETELIVDEVLNRLPATNYQLPITIIDIGAGSGAIIVSIAKNIPAYKLKARSLPTGQAGYQLIATDISDKALYIARKNAKLHKVNKKIKFLRGDLLKPIIKNPKHLKRFNNPKNHTIITANLPYLTPGQFKDEKSIQAEPKKALISGKDGLKDYRKFFKQLKRLSQVIDNNPPANRTIIIEFDPSQTKKLKEIIKSNLPKAKIKTKKDLASLNRIMIVSIKQ